MNAKLLSMLAGILSLTAVQENPVPLVDHHYHLFNTTLTQVTPGLQPITASDAVRALDRAGVRRAVLLSVAYQFGNPNRPAVPNEYVAVQAENDRVSRELARYPDRLRGFCGVNPLKEYALAEIARCATDPHLPFGVKLHFGNSDVDLENMEHRARARSVSRRERQPDGHHGSHAPVRDHAAPVRCRRGPDIPGRDPARCARCACADRASHRFGWVR